MPNLFEKQLTTANLLLQENDLENAIQHYEKALHYAATNNQKIHLFNVLGKLYLETKNPVKAATLFEQSVVLFESTPNISKADRAAVYNNLGAIYMTLALKKAIENYTMALRLYKEAADKDHTFNHHLGNTHFALAEAYSKKKDSYYAKKHFKDAINAYNQLKHAQFDELKAGAHYNLGNFYSEELNLHDAKVNYLKALVFYEKLTDENAEAFQPYLATVYNNLGVTFQAVGDHEKALEYYKNALEHYSYLAEIRTARFLPYVAATYNSMGILSAEMKNLEVAIEYMQRTTGLYNNLVESMPEKYNHYLATSLHNMGLFFLELKKFKEAEEHFLVALKIRKTKAQKEPESFNADVCATSLNLIELYQANMEASLDLDYKAKSIEVLRDVEQRLGSFELDQPVLKTMQSDCRYYLDYFNKVNLESLILNRSFKQVDEWVEEINSTIAPGEKLVFQKQIVDLMKDLLTQYPQNERLKNELAYAYNDLAWLRLRTKAFKEAEDIIKKAQNLQQPITSLRCNLAHAYLFQGDFEKAKELYLPLINEKNSENVGFNTIILKDLKTFEGDGIMHSDFDKIRGLLSN